MLPHESPVHYGLHPNAEIEFLTVTSDALFHTLLELQSPDATVGEGASQSLEEKVAQQHRQNGCFVVGRSTLWKSVAGEK